MMATESTKAITPGVVRGTLEVPPSKSITHRVLILAALSHQQVRIRRILQAEDTQYTLQALQKLGYAVTEETDGVRFNGSWQPPTTQPVQIAVGNSGTTARLITALAARLPLTTVIDGTPRMRQRPMGPLVQALQQLGVSVNHHNGNLPLQISGGTIRARKVTVDPRISSQFVSGLMLIAPTLPDGLVIHMSHAPNSRSYIELTRQLLQQFGISVQWQGNTLTISPGQLRLPPEYFVEGDFSSASYFLIGAHLSGGNVVVKGITRHSLQGDREILAILQAAGATVQEVPDGIQLTAGSEIHPIDWEMQHCPDLVPGVAVMCAFASGTSYLRGIEHLRYKESDRIAAVMDNLQRLGAGVTYADGILMIEPRPLHPATINTYNDHRIAMGFALAGLRIPGVVIENPACVGKSYPGFWEDWRTVVQPIGTEVQQ